MIEARIHLPTPPGEERTAHLEALAEILATANAEWFADQLAQAAEQEAKGRVPAEVPCCIGCVQPEIRYIPPPTGEQQFCQNWWSAPDVLARRRATCLDAAAFDVGAARARDKQAWVQFEPTSRLDYHAVAIIDGIRVDSSEQLQNQECSCVACQGKESK